MAVVEPPKPPPPASPKVRVGLGSGLAFGIAPAAAVGFSVHLGIRWPRSSLSLEGRADLPAASDARGIRTSMISGTLLPCFHFWTYGAACGLVTVGTLRSSLLEDTTPKTPTSSPRASRTNAPTEVVSAPAEVIGAPAELADPPVSATLIKAATVAYERHDVATARSSLEEHARDFPRSKFTTTREVLWVRVLLSEGKRAEAKAKADALRKSVDPSLFSAGIYPKYECIDPPLNCPPTTKCPEFGGSCSVTECSTSKCPYCPDLFENLVIEGWCSYGCMKGAEMVGGAFILQTRWGSMPTKCIGK